MLWLLSLHIVALLVWSAALLYLPSLLASIASSPTSFPPKPREHDSLVRFVYTHIASPAALVSIAAGSGVFWLNRTLEFWLIAKLTLVTLLVTLHAAMGLLVLRAERNQFAGLRLFGRLLTGLHCLLLVLILWLVLAKPGMPEAWRWVL